MALSQNLEFWVPTEVSVTILYQNCQSSHFFHLLCKYFFRPERGMAKLYLEDCSGRDKASAEAEVDDTIWKDLPQELVEKCLGYLPVLTIASKLRAVNKIWKSFPGSPHFMALHNHRKNIDSCFGFLMHGTNILTHRCEIMALNHDTLKWQQAPSLQLEGPHRTCHVESVSEGILCISPHPGTSPPFIVWNPLLPATCKRTIPRMISQDEYWSVNLVVDKANASFKVLAFTAHFRECHSFSSTTGTWHSHHEGLPDVPNGTLFFPTHRNGGHVTVAYQNCLYVAVGRLVNDDVHQIGSLCYDVQRNAWKSSSLEMADMFTLSPELMSLYGYWFTRALFVAADVMYKVVEYVSGVHVVGDARLCPTVQILARGVAPGNLAGKWTVIATTVLPERNWETKGFGTWYMSCCREQATGEEEEEKPTVCAMFKVEPALFLLKFSVRSGEWTTVCVTDVEACSGLLQDDDASSQDDPTTGIMVRGRRSWECQWTVAQRKWLAMKLVPHYQPSWLCPALECSHHPPPLSGEIRKTAGSQPN